MEVLYL